MVGSWRVVTIWGDGTRTIVDAELAEERARAIRDVIANQGQNAIVEFVKAPANDLLQWVADKRVGRRAFAMKPR